MLTPMGQYRRTAPAALLALVACSVTTVEPQGLPEPSAQAMPAARSQLAAPVVAAPAPPVERPASTGFCEHVPAGMRCEPGGPLAGATAVELSPFHVDARPVSAG
jgi:hypothetical protein